MTHSARAGRAHPARPGLTARLRSTLRRRREARRLRTELERFSDRELAELGLFRHDIDAFARRAACGA